MRFGFNLLLWTVSVGAEHAPVFTRLGELGYDGVEVPVAAGTADSYAEIKRYADDAGLACTACALAPPEADPSSPDPAVRRAALDYLRERIDCAATLGSEVLVGPLCRAHGVFTDPSPGSAERGHAAEVFAALGDHAASAGVTLCLEPLNRFEIQLVNTVDDALRIVEATGHSHVAVHYDTHHAHIEEESHDSALGRCAGRLGHVQLSESHRGTLGSGQMNWGAVGRGLREVGYDGWIVAEAFGTGVEPLSTAARVHRNCFESRDQVMRDALPFMRELVSDPAEQA